MSGDCHKLQRSSRGLIEDGDTVGQTRRHCGLDSIMKAVFDDIVHRFGALDDQVTTHGPLDQYEVVVFQCTDALLVV